MKAIDGGALTDTTITKINQISREAETVTAVMGDLMQKSKEIDKIIDVIAGIATETNLLALNAAIEAARAGDAGKGFAVVAEQVRKLAEDSKLAADQIGDLISVIRNGIIEAVSSTNATAQAIADGQSSMELTRSNLSTLFQIIDSTDQEISANLEGIQTEDSHINQIVANVERIGDIIEETSSTTEELSSSTEEIASTLEELSAASEELSALSVRVLEELGKL